MKGKLKKMLVDPEKLQIIKKAAKGRGMQAIILELEKGHDLSEKNFLWEVHKSAYTTGKRKGPSRMRVDFKNNYKWLQKALI